MTDIKNIHLVNDLEPDVIEKMNYAAVMHRKHSRITFKIVEYSATEIIIRVVQDKNPNGNQFEQKRLIEIVHETFDQFFPGRKIKVHPIPYSESPVDQVDSKWIEEKMLATGTKLKDIAKDTGLNKTQLSALVNGQKPLSQVTKALFYYYFMNK